MKYSTIAAFCLETTLGPFSSITLSRFLSPWVSTSAGVGGLCGKVTQTLVVQGSDSHVTIPLPGLAATLIANVDTPILTLWFPDPCIPHTGGTAPCNGH